MGEDLVEGLDVGEGVGALEVELGGGLEVSARLGGGTAGGGVGGVTVVGGAVGVVTESGVVSNVVCPPCGGVVLMSVWSFSL